MNILQVMSKENDGKSFGVIIAEEKVVFTVVDSWEGCMDTCIVECVDDCGIPREEHINESLEAIFPLGAIIQAEYEEVL